MGYKTILTIVREGEGAAAQIAATATLADRFDAHVDILCLGIDTVQVGYYFAGADAVVQQASVALARETAEEIEGVVAAEAKKAGIRWSAQICVAQFGALGTVVADAARFADLVVLPAISATAEATEAEAVLEAALFAGGAAVLLLPPDGLPVGFPQQPVIGWNDSAEALAAVRAGLPALQAAGRTNVAVVDPPRRAAGAAAPGAALSTMLDRHGVKAEVSVLAKDKPRVADILVEQIKAQDGDLLVAGAYSHSRLREALLGGATRTLIQAAPVALLMAH